MRVSILWVGVPRLPEYLSPARARSDPERWGVELLFESLLQAGPRPRNWAGITVRCWRRRCRALAALGPGIHDQARHSHWSGNQDNREVDARAVFGTQELLRRSPPLPCAEVRDVLDTDRRRIEDPFRLKLSFTRGTLEPLNRTTFKVLPGRYLKVTRTRKSTTTSLAGKPFGSGPYLYKGRVTEG